MKVNFLIAQFDKTWNVMCKVKSYTIPFVKSNHNFTKLKRCIQTEVFIPINIANRKLVYKPVNFGDGCYLFPNEIVL